MPKDKNSLELLDKKLSDYTIHWVAIVCKLIPALIAFLWNVAVRKVLCPLIMFHYIRRYIQSVVNMISMKFILMTMGFFRFECEGFRFFTRQANKITLRSGFIGIGNHNSVLDFIYYSYLVNPVFVKILIYKKEGKELTYYCPLSFLESVKCALDYRGFDPIICHNQKDFKHVKFRKLNMKTLISQCFEEVNGPVFIMLPGLSPNEHVSLNKQVSQDIYQNEIRFERSLVGFYVRADPRLKLEDQTYKNQLFLILDQMCRIGNFSMYVNAIEFRRMKMRYDKVTYSTFIDRYYMDHDLTLRQIEYEDYAKEIDEIQKGRTSLYQQESMKKQKQN